MSDIVRKQAELGVDIVDDGEMSKPSFITYINERLAGFEVDSTAPNRSPWVGSREVKAFPEFYAPQLANVHTRHIHYLCTGPVTYRGGQALKTDLDNLKAALNGRRCGRRVRAVDFGVEHRGLEPQRLLQVRRGVPVRAGGRDRRGVSRHCRCRICAAGRRPASGDLLRMPSGQEHGRVPQLDRAAGGRHQPRSARHPEGPGALPHLLRHQFRTARARHRGQAYRRYSRAAECRRVFVRGGQSAARA